MLRNFPGYYLKFALDLIKEFQGGVVIVRDGKLISSLKLPIAGLLSDKKASEIKISEIMSYKFRSVGPTTTIEDAIQKMLNNNIRRLLILDNEKLVGIITQTDLASYLRDQILVDGTIKSISQD